LVKPLTICRILTKYLYQKRVRDLFKERFDVTNNEEYSLHDPPSQQEVRAFTLGTGPGPDPEDPRIDMTGKKNSAWNSRLVDILLEELLKKDWDGMPARSEAYMLDLVESKLERARSVWRNAQPKLKDSGAAETLVEVEKRMVESKEGQSKLNRAYSRRKNVGFKMAVSNRS